MNCIRLSAALALCASLSLAACGTGQTDAVSDNADIIGGFDAAGKSLDAVVSIGMKDSQGNYSFFCSATLIGPHTVLTAKHCAIVLGGALDGQKYVNLVPIFVAVGPAAKTPTQIVEAVAADLSPIENTGFVGLGNDVSIYHLISDITDVKPFKVATAALKGPDAVTHKGGDMGKVFTSIGFGAQTVKEDLTGNLASTRKAGASTMNALEGKSFELMLGSFQAFVDQLIFEYGKAIIDANMDIVTSWYNDTLIAKDYEAWTGHQPGDAQTCHGDSGGPLLHKVNGKLQVFGVVSGGWHSRDLSCDYGTFYATTGSPVTQKLVADALQWTDPCSTKKYGLLDAKGACSGTVAARCSAKWEGNRSLKVLDCADLGQVCAKDTAGVATCADKANTVVPTPPVLPTASLTLGEIKQQIHEVRMGLHSKRVQKLQGR